MKLVGKVISVSDVRTTQSGKELVDIRIENVATGQEMKVACLPGKNGDFTKLVKDDRYDMEVDDTKQYKGKTQYSTGLWLMKKIEKPIPVKEEVVDWDSKEKRAHRRACCAIAASLLTA